MYRPDAAALLAECAGTPTPGRFRPTAPTFLHFLATRDVIPAGIEGAVPTIREWKHAAPSPPRTSGCAGRGGRDAPERAS